MADIVVSESIDGSALDELGREFPLRVDPSLWRDRERLADGLHSARALIVRNQTQVTEALMAESPRLEVVARAGVGLDNIDVAAAQKHGVVVTSATSENALSVAELTIGMMLSISRHLSAADHDTRQGNWNRWRYVGFELAGKTLGIVGYGRIGRLVARRAAAFDMSVLAHDPFIEPSGLRGDDKVARWVSLKTLLADSDVITLHTPLTEGTRGLVGSDAFAAMTRKPLLINTSRGEVIDELALSAALQDGRLRGAALDVRAVEPPSSDALAGLPNVLLTPHIAAFTHEAQDRVLRTICAEVRRVLTGEDARHSVTTSRPSRSTSASTSESAP